MKPRNQLDLSRVRVLDGGLATELERRGVSIAGPLWSARALEEAPEAILAVHRSYLEAGADILLTASYQVSTLGFAAQGFPPEAARAAAGDALRLSVELAVQARQEAARPEALIAASLGPYGAALANGAEFHGHYDFPSHKAEHQALVAFHADRIAAAAPTEADLLAFETVPKLAEARAIAEALQGWPDLGAWVSFTCRDTAHTAHGELVRDCAEFLEDVPQVLAVGVNCTPPSLIALLLRELHKGTQKPLLAYPNSGETWDSAHHCWTGAADVAGFGTLAASWFAQGAQAVGGCCRTGPEHVRAAASALRSL